MPDLFCQVSHSWQGRAFLRGNQQETNNRLAQSPLFNDVQSHKYQDDNADGASPGYYPVLGCLAHQPANEHVNRIAHNKNRATGDKNQNYNFFHFRRDYQLNFTQVSKNFAACAASIS